MVAERHPTSLVSLGDEVQLPGCAGDGGGEEVGSVPAQRPALGRSDCRSRVGVGCSFLDIKQWNARPEGRRDERVATGGLRIQRTDREVS